MAKLTVTEKDYWIKRMKDEISKRCKKILDVHQSQIKSKRKELLLETIKTLNITEEYAKVMVLSRTLRKVIEQYNSFIEKIEMKCRFHAEELKNESMQKAFKHMRVCSLKYFGVPGEIDFSDQIPDEMVFEALSQHGKWVQEYYALKATQSQIVDALMFASSSSELQDCVVAFQEAIGDPSFNGVSLFEMLKSISKQQPPDSAQAMQ